ncbi:MAG: rhomboid protease GluP [Acidobacteriota bacterium]|nr:rhomboid protease GluP [Acidobacteriota bacterium]
MIEGESKGAGAQMRRTGVCSHCGALVGAGESRCMMCGTPATPSRESSPRRAHAADPETLRFLRAVISRRATFTFIFIVANIFLYLLMWLSGGATGAVLLAYGAKLNYLIDHEGQWWRFVTPVFLHVQLPGLGPLHLLSNMYGLFMLGPFVEKLYGSARFVVIWVLTGVVGVAASYLAVRPEWAHGALGQFLFKSYDSPSAGASGALFGLMGVLFVFGIKYRHELPEGLKRAFGTGLLPTLLINLFIGYVGRGFIDNAAHLGGLLSGMGLGLVVGYKRPGAIGAAVTHTWHAAQVACLLLVVMSFAMVMRHFDAPPPRLSNLTERVKMPGSKPPVVPFIEAINAGQNALASFLHGDDGALASAAERLEKTPTLSPEADALRNGLKTLLASARAIAGDTSLKPDERAQRLKQLDADFGGWQERFSQWVDGEGGDFGVGIQKNEKSQDSKSQPEEQK